MLAENVDVVRRHYEALDEALAAYWEQPEPVERSASLGGVLDQLDPEAEWYWLFSPEVFRGREQLLEAAADWMETVEGWRIEVDELINASNDQVFAAIRARAHGRGSGAPAAQMIYSAVTLRNGKIVRFKDHVDRSEALAAVGLA